MEKKNLEKLIFKLFDPLSLQNTNTKRKISKTLQIDKTEKFECPIQIFSTDQINSHIIHICNLDGVKQKSLDFDKL